MLNGRIKQAVVGLLMFSCVSGVAASVTLSQMHGGARIRRAVQSQPKAAPKATVKVASETLEKVAVTATAAATVAERLTEKEVATLSAVASRHSVRLVNGSITGAIQVIGAGNLIHNLTDVRVAFMRNGVAVTQVSPGSDGVFQASVPPGRYTVVAIGPSGYAAYGLEVVDPEVAVQSASFKKADSQLSLQIETLAVPTIDQATAFRLIHEGLKTSAPLPPMAAPVPTVAPLPAATLPDVHVANAPPQTSIQHHTVNLEADGTLLGKITRLDRLTGNLLTIHSVNAFLIQNGAIVHQTTIAPDGSLKFSAVNPGVYSFVTAGVEGFSAFGVVVAPAVATAAASTEIRTVSFQPEGAGGPLTGTLGFPEDGPPPPPPPVEPPPPPPGEEPPVGGGGGFGGGGAGGGFGGGAGGGGLGLGGLLGLAGLGLGAAALADDDDDDDPVSPAGP